jgi:hypothetical protein
MVRLIFHGTNRSETNQNEISVYATIHNEIYLQVKQNDYQTIHICLDRETSIKLSKELRKQIALIEP